MKLAGAVVVVTGASSGLGRALVRMKRQGSGVIINIISTSALEGRALSAAYCASKYAVKGFTQSLQHEVAGTGVFVIAVYPGGMQTHLFDEQKPGDFGTYMNPADVARTIVSNVEQNSPLEELIIRRT